MNKDCSYFQRHFPDLLIEPDACLLGEWNQHQRECKNCSDSFQRVSEQQEYGLQLTKQLVKSIPVPRKWEVRPKLFWWKKYLVAAIVLVLLSLQFYILQMRNTPSLREKIVILLEKELFEEYVVDDQEAVIDRLITYGSNFYYDFQKLASLAEVYQNKLEQSNIVFTKTRLLLNSRVYIHTIDQVQLKNLIAEDNPEDIKSHFIRAIENIGIDNVTKSVLLDYFRESLPLLLTLRVNQDKVFEHLNQNNMANLTQDQKRYIIWKVEQYFIKNIY